MPLSMPAIKELNFPDDGRVWRIDWLGTIDRIGPDARIKVYLSSQGAGDHNLSSPNALDAKVNAVVQVGIRLLPWLSVGSLWQHGRRLKRNTGERLRLPGVSVPERPNVHDAFSELGCFDGHRRRLIPRFAHPIEAECREAPCLTLEYGGDPHGIVIPAIEVIRFYYAVSSDLAHIAFNGDLWREPNQVLNRHGPIANGLQDDGNMVLHLRKHLEDNDAWILGRVIANQHNKSAFNWIYNSLAYNHRHKRPLFVKAGFPFTGETSWQARVCVLPSEIPGKNRYLIYELLSCSAPFPFQNVVVVRDNDNRKGKTEADEQKAAWKHRPTNARMQSDVEIQSQDAPHSRFATIALSNISDRFNALQGKRIIKLDKEKCKYRSETQTHTEDADFLCLREASGSQDAQNGAPAEISWQREEVRKRPALAASFENLMHVVEALRRIPGVSAQKRNLPTAIGHIPLTKQAGTRQWSYLDSTTRTLRQVVIVDVSAGGRHGSLIEFECREYEHIMAALLISTVRERITNDQIRVQLVRLAKAQGIWSSLRLWPENTRHQFFKHSRPSDDEFARAIHAAIINDE